MTDWDSMFLASVLVRLSCSRNSFYPGLILKTKRLFNKIKAGSLGHRLCVWRLCKSRYYRGPSTKGRSVQRTKNHHRPGPKRRAVSSHKDPFPFPRDFWNLLLDGFANEFEVVGLLSFAKDFNLRQPATFLLWQLLKLSPIRFSHFVG